MSKLIVTITVTQKYKFVSGRVENVGKGVNSPSPILCSITWDCAVQSLILEIPSKVMK